MRCSTLAIVFLSTVAFAPAAIAGVAGTSAGVTTTIGNSNEPSADVQAQSAGFVQKNQQAQQGGQSVNGVVLPVGAAPDPTQAAADKSAAALAGKSVDGRDASGAAAASAAAETAPPPPPVYESTMRRLEKRNAPATPPPTTVEASGPPGAVRKDDGQPAVKLEEPAPAAAAAPAQAQAKPAAPAPRVTTPVVEASPERITPPAVTGGRGEAPDGFTFYSGVTISGALLAFALATFLRIGRNEGAG